MGNEISRLFVAIGAKTTEFHKGMDGVQGKMDRVSKKMKIAGGIMVAAIAAIGVASLKMAGDFDGAMREVNTMMLLNEAEFRIFSKDVQNLAKDMGVSAVDAAKALYQAISAGVPRENVVEFLRIATKAAIGGVTDTVVAVDALTTILNAYKLPVGEAERISDILFTTVKGGKTTFAELAISMSQAMPTAAALGVGYEAVLAAVATMTKQGVPTARAFTQIRMAMVALMKPTTEMSEIIHGLGYESGEAMLESLGFIGTLETLKEATAGNNEMLGKMFGSVEAIQAVMALTGDNFQSATADLDAMADSTGAATDAYEQMERSTGRQLQKLKVQFQDMAITLGMALMPALKKLLGAITPIISKIGEWIEKHPDLTLAIGGTVLALGALMLLAGPLLNAIRLLIGIFRTLRIAMHLTKIAAIAMWGAVTLGISLLVVGVVELVNHLRKAEREIRDLAGTMKSEMKAATDSMISNLEQENLVLVESIKERRRLWKEAHFERMSQLDEQFWAELKAIAPEKFEKLLPLYKEWLGLQEDINDIIKRQADLRAIEAKTELELAQLRKEEIEVELARPGLDKATRIQLEEELALLKADLLNLDIELAQLASEDIRARIALELEEIPEEDIDAYFGPLVTAAEVTGLEAIQAVKDLQSEWAEAYELPFKEFLEWLETEGMPEYKRIMAEAGMEPSVTELPEYKEEGIPWWANLHPILGLIGAIENLRGIPGMKGGGIARSPTLAMIGEDYKPEAVVPLDQSGMALGKTEIHNHFGVFVGDEIALRKLYRMMMQQIGGEEGRRSSFGQLNEGYFFGRRAL